ncbi:MAG: hypothetical protein KGS61_22130, partial [Verrucomicrobia bacterium]|nr:hypothetical protein [Verrucomicrobiota bacterium]
PPPPGFTIPLHDDVTAYGDHTVLLTLRNPSSNLVLGALSNAVLTIRNDNTAAGVQVGLNGPVNTMVVQPDGKVVIGGEFTLVDGRSRNHLARLNSDTTLDPTFDPGTGTDASVLALALQADERIIVGGAFTNLNGVYCGRIARLNPDGSVDRSFDSGLGWSGPINPSVNPGVTAVAVQSDGRILTGGSLTNFNGTQRPGIARLNPDGSLDTGFVPEVRCFKVTGLVGSPDGQTLVAGTLGLTPVGVDAGLVRLNTDGTVDTNFSVTNFYFGDVTCMAVEPNGDILAAPYGGFGPTLPAIKPNGIEDPAFRMSSVSGWVGDITIQNDGKILVTSGPYGSLFSYEGWYYTLLRLNPDGSVDATFQGLRYPSITNTYNVSMTVDKTAALPDGTILVTGTFSEGATRPPFYLWRLNPDGSGVQDLHFLPPVRLPNGQLHLALRGQWSKPYALQVSEDLTNWITVATNDRPHVPIGYIDSSAPGFRQRFYRVH